MHSTFRTMAKTAFGASLLMILAHTALAANVTSMPTPELAHLGDGVVGALHRPATATPKAGIAVYVMHAEQDYLDFPVCHGLAARGYTVLCANNAASKMGLGNDLDFERMMQDVAKGVQYLRSRPEIRKIVLLGHSGGGAMMTAYQNIAENGLRACQGAEKIVPCSDAMAQLPRADGLLLLDANYGISGMTLLSLDLAVQDEGNAMALNPHLNLFAPEHGFTPAGARYTPEIISRFQAGVAARMSRLVQHALDRQQQIKAGKGRFADDEPFVVPGASYIGFNNKLFAQDTSLLAHTAQAWPLLHKDGSMTRQVVYSLRSAANLKPNTQNYGTGALKTTVNRFLSTFAIRVNPDFAYGAEGFSGVDWSSSHTAPIGAIQGVTAPLLTMGMTGHWEYLAAEKIYLHAASKDKSIAFVEGASHMLTTCKDCEKTPGQYGDTLKVTLDHADQWLSGAGRFLE